MVREICFGNAREHFGFELGGSPVA
jgi:hypothetical protein